MRKEKLLGLLSDVTNIYSCASYEESLETKRKDGNLRDVVTKLDNDLHAVALKFAQDNDLGIISEEGELQNPPVMVEDKHYLLVDPIDGSLNFYKKINYYCSLFAIIENFRITCSAICLPCEKQLVFFDCESNELITSKPIENDGNIQEGAVYIAYSSSLKSVDRELRTDLINEIDSLNFGFFRFGSSGCGLYQTLQGKLSAFVGVQIKIWDALSFLPIAFSYGFSVAYAIDGYNLDLIITKNKKAYDKFLAIFSINNHHLKVYSNINKLDF